MAHQTHQTHQGSNVQAQGSKTDPLPISHKEMIEDYAFRLFNQSSERYNSLCDIVGDSMNALVERENELARAHDTYTEIYDKLVSSTDFASVFGLSFTDAQVASWTQHQLTLREDGIKLVAAIGELEVSIRNHKRIISVQQSYLPMLKHQMEFAVASLRSI